MASSHLYPFFTRLSLYCHSHILLHRCFSFDSEIPLRHRHPAITMDERETLTATPARYDELEDRPEYPDNVTQEQIDSHGHLGFICHINCRRCNHHHDGIWITLSADITDRVKHRCSNCQYLMFCSGGPSRTLSVASRETTKSWMEDPIHSARQQDPLTVCDNWLDSGWFHYQVYRYS